MKAKAFKFSFWQTVSFILLAILLTFWLTSGGLGNILPDRSLVSIPVRQEISGITPDQLKASLATKDFTLINVHTPYEGEIEKTDAFIEFDKIEENISKLPKDKNAKIILYCQTGRMSEEAGKKLLSLGYANVSHLKGGMEAWRKAGLKTFNVEELKKQVVPDEGFAAPVNWGDIGPRLVALGVIDLQKFQPAVQPTAEQLEILTKKVDEPIRITPANAQFVVDVLWAFGLAQKSKVYTEGPMGREYKNEAGNFASTGGWSLAKGPAIDYLGKYDLVKLSSQQQDRVYRISQNVYRPCCGNPTSFPDCNHGMAALALIELMVEAGQSDEQIYKTVLGFNSIWFSQTYLALAAKYALTGVSWDQVDPKTALSQQFSSGQGAAALSKEVGNLPYLYRFQGGGCGA